MADTVDRTVPKKFYRYCLKALSYYTFHLNRACTLRELQAYVFLKSLEQLNEAELTSVTEEVMEQLVSTRVANLTGGCYRLNELLRPEHGEPAERHNVIDPSNPPGSSKQSPKVGKTVTFSSVVTMWDAVTVDSDLSTIDDEVSEDINSSQDSTGNGQDGGNPFKGRVQAKELFDTVVDTSSNARQDCVSEKEFTEP